MARPIGPVRSAATLLLAALTAGACGRTARPRVTSPTPDACALVPPPDVPVDSASILLTSTVDARHLAHPASWAERFVVDLATDTIARVDCQGRRLDNAAGPYRITDLGRSTLLLEPAAGARGPRLTIRSAADATARDLIDAGVDLLLTENPAIAAYGAARPNVTSVPLGWNRTWVGVTALPRGLGIDTSSTVRSELARDVVPADARAAVGPYWWLAPETCAASAMPDGKTPASPGGSRIVYPRDEPIARALAERLVALAGAGTVATGLAPNAFDSALRAGTDLIYVLPLQRLPLDRCRATGDLAAAAPWMARSPNPRGTITPLIDTRTIAVIRRDRLRLVLTSDSSIAISAGLP